MKTKLVAVVLGMTLMFTGGCSGGGSGGDDSTGTEENANNNDGSSSENDDSRPPAAEGIQEISSEALGGYTVVSEYKSGPKFGNIKKTHYIFLDDKHAIAVFDLFDGSIKVARDNSYTHFDGNNVAFLNPTWDNGDEISTFIPAISTEVGYSKITVGHSTANPYDVTQIVSNEDNGIDEETVTATGGSSSPSTSSGDDSVLNNKNLSIYNNIDVAKAFGSADYLEKNSDNIYESSTPLHCTDYGYSSADIVAEETTALGTHNMTYMHGTLLCIEVDYAGSSAAGSNNYATYPDD